MPLQSDNTITKVNLNKKSQCSTGIIVHSVRRTSLTVRGYEVQRTYFGFTGQHERICLDCTQLLVQASLRMCGRPLEAQAAPHQHGSVTVLERVCLGMCFGALLCEWQPRHRSRGVSKCDGGGHCTNKQPRGGTQVAAAPQSAPTTCLQPHPTQTWGGCATHHVAGDAGLSGVYFTQKCHGDSTPAVPQPAAVGSCESTRVVSCPAVVPWLRPVVLAIPYSPIPPFGENTYTRTRCTQAPAIHYHCASAASAHNGPPH